MNAPGGQLSVREASLADLAAVVRLERLCFTDPWSDEALLAELECDPLRLPLVAERAGLVCGYLMAWCVVDQLHILNIAADPHLRRAGVGTALLLASAEIALGRGLTEATLEVRRSNHEARQFYTRHGFREVGLRAGYYHDNGEDAIIMTTSLAGLVGPGFIREDG